MGDSKTTFSKTAASETTGARAPAPKRRARPCPICNGLSVQAYHPFCSKRCADVDLHRWLSGGYRIPVVEETPDEGELGGGEVDGR